MISPISLLLQWPRIAHSAFHHVAFDITTRHRTPYAAVLLQSFSLIFYYRTPIFHSYPSLSSIRPSACPLKLTLACPPSLLSLVCTTMTCQTNAFQGQHIVHTKATGKRRIIATWLQLRDLREIYECHSYRRVKNEENELVQREKSTALRAGSRKRHKIPPASNSKRNTLDMPKLNIAQ